MSRKKNDNDLTYPALNLDPEAVVIKRVLDKTETQVEDGTGCWLYQGALANGYGIIATPEGTDYTHRVIYKAFHGDIEAKRVIAHTCNRKNCCNPFHLRQVSQQQNCQMASKDGLLAKTRPRLTTSEVEAIRAKSKEGKSIAEIAAVYGRTMTHISNIVSGRYHKPKTPKTPKRPKRPQSPGNPSPELIALRAQREHLQTIADDLGSLLESAEKTTKRAA